MSVRSTLARGQATAERLFTASVQLKRPGGVTADPTTGADVETLDLIVEDPVAAKFQRAERNAPPAVAGDRVDVTSLRVDLPVSCPVLVIGDVVHVVSDALNAELAGADFRITDTPDESYRTAKRYPVERLA